ncbi:hypothetical protein AN1344.2 [Aspergillus nidulans FGSC A4]|nr:hypothetical protein AN1344.2 [Aspergillus nidulans FGSC A4]|eukprot:XP_658948.1 hypothetical protein AN1344.2 [Aspergillus nidulans FGSC A4]
MPATSAPLTPGLASFLKSLKTNPIDTSIDNLISVISACRTSDASKLIERVQSVGRRLIAAQPREMVVGNIVRRVLGLIRDEAEDDRDGDFTLSDAGSESQPQTPRAGDEPSEFHGSDRGASKPISSLATHPVSMFSLLSHPEPETSLPGTPATGSPSGRLPGHTQNKDIRAEVLDGINEIIDELGQVDDQIAAYALDHIHSNEIILTHTSSTTVQKFLLKAAAKRKFTVIHAESYPNNHEATHATVSGAASNDDEILSTESFQKPLIAHGITVILIPDSAVFALMSRVNKVILGTHSVLANGGLVAAAGTRVIARAAKVHQTPCVVVSGVYKLSPVYPFDFESLIEYGDSSKVIDYEDGDLVDQIDVQNPLYDYVPAELVDLYITNLGGHAPSYLYRIVSDHYRKEDISF